MTIRWIWAFLDRPATQFDECAEFWTAVTATTLSAKRGANSEFVTLLPDSGAPAVKMQAVPHGPRIHLDLDVEDVPTEVDRAVKLGATLVLEHPEHTVLKSPHGMIFCLTPAGTEGEIAPVVTGPEGDRSRLDQVCLDIGPSDHDEEVKFWTELTGWRWMPGSLPEYSRLTPDSKLPVKLLLQRLEQDRPTAAHLDLACTDIETTAAWHEKLGAHRVRWGTGWLVMTDPAGQEYCLTGRDPE
ncbi:VOC family protein [Nocardia sp. NBC_01503]|uniref:VOC family protein n=1 Tax=Nocardia sp. NBC_01503 TaxID=2975997 RepID=UPI002E7B149A|nr:VOC family protein [Nocardia sp. NBC_01503]WTL30011.1 VOC family protein [Nocardia sp. NBC_01503]